MSVANPRGRSFTIREAAEYLELPPKALYRLCALRRISHYRSDGHLLERQTVGGSATRVKSGRIWFYQSDLDAWLDGQRVTCGEAPAVRLTPASITPAEPWAFRATGERRFA
jgi:hypothetical protein